MFTGLVEKIGTVKRVSRGRGLVIEFAFEPTSLEGTGKELVRSGVYYVSDPNYEFDIRTITDFDHDFLTKIAENDRPLSYYYVRWSGYKH